MSISITSATSAKWIKWGKGRSEYSDLLQFVADAEKFARETGESELIVSVVGVSRTISIERGEHGEFMSLTLKGGV